MANFNGLAAIETPEFLMARLDKLGGPESYNHYAVGWAHAMNTPYQWTKQVASHWGGTRNGTIVHWPNGIKAKGEIRSQFHHVIDVAPTILEAAGLPEPISVNGVQQKPIEGVSMLYSFNDAKAAERHETQYFEMFGNRGIYHKGWTAVTKHGTPWVLVGRKTVPLDDDVWELYDTSKDWSQANDLAKQMPEKLHELQRLWLIEATRYNVLPIDDRVVEKMNPDTAGRPVLIKGNTQLLFGGMGRLSENCVLNIKNKSHSVTAEIEVPQSGAEGVIIAQGANIGGWSLYAKDGKLKYCYNVAGVNHFYVEAANARCRPASTRCAWSSPTPAAASARAAQVTLYVDGKKVGEGAIPMTQAMVFSADDGCDVGEDSGAPVSPDYGSRGNAFNGTGQGRAARHRRRGRELGSPRLAGGCHPHRDGTAVVEKGAGHGRFTHHCRCRPVRGQSDRKRSFCLGPHPPRPRTHDHVVVAHRSRADRLRLRDCPVLQPFATDPGARPAYLPTAPEYLGLALISCGVLALVISIWQYRWGLRYLWGEPFTPVAGVTTEGMQTPIMAVAILLIGVGLFAFFAVLFRTARRTAAWMPHFALLIADTGAQSPSPSFPIIAPSRASIIHSVLSQGCWAASHPNTVGRRLAGRCGGEA